MEWKFWVWDRTALLAPQLEIRMLLELLHVARDDFEPSLFPHTDITILRIMVISIGTQFSYSIFSVLLSYWTIADIGRFVVSYQIEWMNKKSFIFDQLIIRFNNWSIFHIMHWFGRDMYFLQTVRKSIYCSVLLLGIVTNEVSAWSSA